MTLTEQDDNGHQLEIQLSRNQRMVPASQVPAATGGTGKRLERRAAGSSEG